MRSTKRFDKDIFAFCRMRLSFDKDIYTFCHMYLSFDKDFLSLLRAYLLFDTIFEKPLSGKRVIYNRILMKIFK